MIHFNEHVLVTVRARTPNMTSTNSFKYISYLASSINFLIIIVFTLMFSTDI